MIDGLRFQAHSVLRELVLDFTFPDEKPAHLEVK